MSKNEIMQPGGEYENIKINLFTTELKPVGEYTAPAVPREGDYLTWEGAMYEVKTVTWEGLPDHLAVQIRMGLVHD